MEPKGPESTVGYHLWHATLAWKAEIGAALEPHDLTPTQFFVLGATNWLIRTEKQAPSQSEVARFTGVDAMTTSQVVRALAGAGLIDRSDDPNDSRSWRLGVTEKGRSAVEAASAAVRAADRRFFASLKEEAQSFAMKLKTLREESRSRS